MKKKSLIICLGTIVILMLCCINASAARRTTFPVTITEKSYYSTYSCEVTDFKIYSVENLSGKYKNRIYYYLEYEENSYVDLVGECYNAQGYSLGTVDINRYSDYIDVPDVTAMIELKAKSPASYSDTYFYCKYVNVYAADGRVMGVCDLQVPVYEMVGWYAPVTVFADDGREMEISPFQTQAYEQVGWYTYETMLYREICKFYNDCKVVQDYNSMMEYVDLYLEDFIGTKYEQSMYTMKTQAMDLWRKSSGAPLVVSSYYTDENSIGTPEVTIDFRNVSYKNIIAFKLKFTCYNIFGEVEESYYSNYYCDDAYIYSGDTGRYTWTLYGADSVNKIANFVVTEVVYDDGTKWYR